MSDGLEITFEGMKKFEANMVELAGTVAEKVARQAVRAGGRVVQAAITQMAPVRPDLPSGTALPPGALQADIELHVVKERDGSVSAYVEPGKLTKHVARFVEYGHEQGGGEKRLIGGHLEGKHVRAHPFIRPAFEMSEVEALGAAEEAIAIGLTKEARRLGNI